MKKPVIWCLSLLVCLVFLVSCKNESKTNFLPFNIGDRVSASAVMLNAATMAYQEGGTYRAAFAASGAGIAVWASNSGTGQRVLYSVFDPTHGTWSGSQVLAVDVDLNGNSLAVASNGTGFMVAFISGNNFVYAVPWSGGSFSAPQKISNGGYCEYIGLASNGTGYCLVWSQYNGTHDTPRGAIHDGAAWGYPRELDSNNSENFRVISNGGGYCATWNSNNRLNSNIYYNPGSGWSWKPNGAYADNIAYQDNYQVAGNGAYYVVVFQESGRIYARTFDLAAGPPIWSVVTPIDNGANEAYVARIATNGTNFCVVFSQTDGVRSNIYANFFNGAWSGPVEIDAGNEAATNPDVATDGSNYCAVWTQNDGTAQRAYANIYTGAWAGATALNSSGTNTSNNAFVSSNGSGFLARWVDYISGNNYRLTASLYGGSWSAPAAIDAAALPHNPPAAGIVSFAGGYGAYYSSNPDDRSMTIEANVLMNGAWVGAANLYTQQWKGSCLENEYGNERPKILTAGDITMAVWAQYDQGNTRLFASMKSGAKWGDPLLLADDIYEFSAAVGGNNICVAYTFYDITAAADPYRVRTRIFDSAAGTWSAGEDLEAVNYYNDLGDIFVAGSGSARDFCVAWRVYDTNYYVRAKVHNSGTGWDATPHEINGGANQMDILKLVGGADFYCIIFDQDVGTPATYTALYDAETTTWDTPDPVVDGTTQIGNDTMAVAASGLSIAIAWPDASVMPNNLYVKLFDGTWHAPEDLSHEGLTTDNPAVAGDGAGGFCLAWQESGYGYTTVYTRQYAAATGWEAAPADISFVPAYGTNVDAHAPRVASNGIGYAAVFYQYDEYGVGSLYANVYDEGLWLGAEALDNLNSDIVDGDQYAIASNGDGYGVVWRQNDTKHGTMLYGSSYRRDTWHNVALSNGKGDVTYCDITAGEKVYTPFWFQTDEEDVLVENVWANRMR